MEYASGRKRQRDKSFSHSRTRCDDQRNRVDFCKSNRPRVGHWPHWNLANRRGRRNDQQPSHQTIQTRRRESMHFDDIPIVLPLFAFHLLKDFITGLKWNETTKYLASCSWGGWMKVKFHSFDANWLTNGKTRNKRWRHWFRIFLLSFQIWSMDSDEPVHSLEVDSRCYCLTWRPNGKTDDVDGGIDAARKLKENLSIAW